MIYIFGVFLFLSFQILMPDKEKTKIVPSTEKRKADDFEQKDLKKVNECFEIEK